MAMIKPLITRRRLLRTALGAGAGAGAMLGYAMGIEPHWFEITGRDMVVAGLPEWWHGRTLVHMSDLHLGPRVADDYLLQVFAAVDAMAADMVIYTGDFVDNEPGILGHAGRLAKAMPLGKVATFGVLGNHDYGKNWGEPDLADSLVNVLQTRGISMLRNRNTIVRGLAVAGFDDLWAERCVLADGMAGLTPGAPALALAHNPDTVDLPGWEGFNGWIFSGHTHGGQCKPPFLPPPLLPVVNRRYVAGEYALGGGRTMYISRGVGHLLRARFNVRPEIAVFRLVRG